MNPILKNELSSELFHLENYIINHSFLYTSMIIMLYHYVLYIILYHIMLCYII